MSDELARFQSALVSLLAEGLEPETIRARLRDRKHARRTPSH